MGFLYHRLRLWPNGIIPYKINSSHFPREMPDRQDIEDAIVHWNEVTVVRLVPHDGEHDFVEFVTHASSCWSRFGRVGGRQEVRCDLASGHHHRGSIIHEIGHVAGVIHEHTRPDRIEHGVTVHYDNLKPSCLRNYDIRDGHRVGSYDYGSITHYFNRSSVCAIDVTQNTISAPQPIGQRNGLSAGDIATIKYVYDSVLGLTHLAQTIASIVS